MTQKTTQTLYTNSTKTQYYLVPSVYILPEGEYSISTLSGEETQVDQTALAHFAISEEDAKNHITASHTVHETGCGFEGMI